MTREKIIKGQQEKKIFYSKKRWKKFANLREEAKKILKCLFENNLNAIIHGSLARGDVRAKSDIDIFIKNNISSFQLDIALQKYEIIPYKKEISQATAWQLKKAHYYINSYTSISFPLENPKKQEIDFYYFGGAINYPQIKKNMRVAGIDKRLMIIKPTKEGHIEYSLVGNEKKAIKEVGLNYDIIKERIEVLTRRDKIGRTGVLLKKEIPPDMSVEQFAKYLQDRNPALKKRK